MSGDENFLSRWSRRKQQARTGSPEADEAQAAPVQHAAAAASAASAATQDEQPGPPPPLPPVESLTPESDFTPFMRAGIEPGLKRQALKTLFGDPRFNVMDGLDVYIDDYSKPDPLPAGWLEKLNQVARLGVRDAPEPDRPEAGDDVRASTEAQPEGSEQAALSDTTSDEQPAAPMRQSSAAAPDSGETSGVDSAGQKAESRAAESTRGRPTRGALPDQGSEAKA